jgi:hypothetical protein
MCRTKIRKQAPLLKKPCRGRKMIQRQKKALWLAVLTGILAGLYAQETDFSSDTRAEPDRENWDIESLDTARDAGYLNGVEKDVILEMNMARSDPVKYAELYIRPLLAFFRGNLFRRPGDSISTRTHEGPGAVNHCIRNMNNMRSAPVLRPEPGLSLGARDHAEDTGPSGRTGHTGGDGSSFVGRVSRYGRRGGLLGENIDYGMKTGRDIVLHLLIDDGVPSRGHFSNIMNRSFSLAGVAFGYHTRYGYMCVIDYAENYTSSIPPENPEAP